MCLDCFQNIITTSYCEPIYHTSKQKSESQWIKDMCSFQNDLAQGLCSKIRAFWCLRTFIDLVTKKCRWFKSNVGTTQIDQLRFIYFRSSFSFCPEKFWENIMSRLQKSAFL
jgi:hypothetical protein